MSCTEYENNAQVIAFCAATEEISDTTFKIQDTLIKQLQTEQSGVVIPLYRFLIRRS
jgi:hypothetical protein